MGRTAWRLAFWPADNNAVRAHPGLLMGGVGVGGRVGGGDGRRAMDVHMGFTVCGSQACLSS